MSDINIGGTVIDFPDSSESPNWSEPIISFAEAVEDALAGLIGGADISPTSFSLDIYNGTSSVTVTSLQFSTSTVRGAFVDYTVYRTANVAQVAYESGRLMLIYNSAGSAWEIVREYVGDAGVTFTVNSSGQVLISLSTLGVSNHVGKMTFTAKAILQAT